MTKDAKDNKRGCFIFAAVVAALLAALAWGIASSGDDPRSNVAAGARGATAPVDPAD
ncbi:MAG TPA: hypothetical protein VFQ67_00050 [Allosphingosinicella sp.]|jgi:glutathione synthase/RimK-type ligase-like ATP-grasp enzyme|nr:hypothetical protein [Allosphingosinicella sp.]